MGEVGYPFRSYQPRDGFLIRYESEPIEVILAEMGVDPDDTPWKPGLHAIAAQYGKLVVMPDPGWCNQHDSFCRAMDALGDDWERLILVCGDTLFSSKFLAQVIDTLPWPSQFSMHHNHAIFLLNREGANTYRVYTETHRRRSYTHAGWEGTTRQYPDGSWGSGMMGVLGIKHCGWHTPPWCDMPPQVWETFWLDVDGIGSYEDAQVKIQKGWFV